MRFVKSVSLLTLLLLSLSALAQTPAAPAGAPSEAAARKQRSLEQLKAEDVPLATDLPPFPDSSRVKLRSREEIAQRAIGVCLAALKAERADQTMIEGLVKRYKAKKFLTPEEAEFIDANAPTNEDRDKYLWRYEDLWVLMWALGYVDELGRPDHTCDIHKTVAPLSSRTTEEFIKDAKLRSLAEILDAADLSYRYHGAVFDALMRNKKAPAGLNRGVVAQRHHALNWLVSYLNQPWESVADL